MPIRVLISVLLLSSRAFAAPSPSPVPAHEATGAAEGRVASVFISQDFINEQLSQHMKSPNLQDGKVVLDPEHDQILFRGILDPKLGRFRFQLAIRLETTKVGHLILEFPLKETFFYPADSKNPEEDRVVIPVQMLSLALASARGYLAAISGDFGGFDRRAEKVKALIKGLDRSISEEKNADALEDLKTQRESLRIQLEAMPIERRQLQSLAKEYESLLSFTGEKELSLNDELVARKNALILKIKLSQLTPYLKGTELGGVRIRRDKKDGKGENYLAIDFNADLGAPVVGAKSQPSSERKGMKTAPALIMRLNQALFESEAVLAAEKEKMGENLHEFDLQLRDDGLHVSGKWKAFLFTVPFDTIVDFVSTGPDKFEARVRDIEVAGIDLEFLSGYVLDVLKKRLDASLSGICDFKNVGEQKDHSRALQVSVDPKKLVPAFPDLHLVEVDVREREFLLKIGKN
jgi:hypothetical protein